MNRFILSIVLLLFHHVAIAQETFLGEFHLKSTNNIPGSMLEREYRIAVDGGAATVKFTRDGKAREDKGSVSLAIFNGLDPLTRKPAKFSGFLRIEVTNPGWAADTFVARFDIPIEPPKAGQKPPPSPGDELKGLEFASNASAEMLWVEVLDNGLTRYLDPMHVRLRMDYSVKVIKNPFESFK